MGLVLINPHTKSMNVIGVKNTDMNVISKIKTTLPSCIRENKIFTYDGEHIKAIAFLSGMKNKKLNELKQILRKSGFEYDFQYECYLKNDCTGVCMDEYRTEKDNFISSFINWKVGKS